MRTESLWPDGTQADAIFSEDERHRYLLSRVFPTAIQFGAKPFPAFLMLNPSTADALRNDATVIRCIGFTKRLGYDAFQVINLFSLRATKPKELLHDRDAEGDPTNLAMILEVASLAEIVICAWGTLGELRQRRLTVVRALRDAGLGHKLHCLGRNVDGSPRHPLYLPSEAPLENYFGMDIVGAPAA